MRSTAGVASPLLIGFVGAVKTLRGPGPGSPEAADSVDLADKIVAAILGSLEMDLSCNLSNLQILRSSIELEMEPWSELPAQRLEVRREDPFNSGIVGGGLLLSKGLENEGWLTPGVALSRAPGLPLDMEPIEFVGAVKTLRGVAVGVEAVGVTVGVAACGANEGTATPERKPELASEAGARKAESLELPKAGAVLGAPRLCRCTGNVGSEDGGLRLPPCAPAAAPQRGTEGPRPSVPRPFPGAPALLPGVGTRAE